MAKFRDLGWYCGQLIVVEKKVDEESKGKEAGGGGKALYVYSAHIE